jgi:multidrug efflux pump subunit AcrB
MGTSTGSSVAVVVLALGGTLFMFVGRDFFPIIDGGQIQLHVRVPAGTRIEKTEQMFQEVEDKIRESFRPTNATSSSTILAYPPAPTTTRSAMAQRPEPMTA